MVWLWVVFAAKFRISPSQERIDLKPQLANERVPVLAVDGATDSRVMYDETLCITNTIARLR